MYPPELVAILILLLVPLFAAVLLAVLNRDSIRNGIVGVVSAVLIAASLYLAYLAWSSPAPITIALESAKVISVGLFIVELVVALAIIALSLKYRRILPLALALIQLALLLVLELVYAESVIISTAFTVNNLSAIMVLIIGIIGTLICVYALGYMKDYHHHHTEVADRKPYFFAMLFTFLTAMLLLGSNNALFIPSHWILKDTRGGHQLIPCGMDEPHRRDCIHACDHLSPGN